MPVANPSECKGGEGDFLSPIICIYMKAKLELFIDSIKTLSLNNSESDGPISLSSPFVSDRGCWMPRCRAGGLSYKGSLQSGSYAFLLLSRT